MFIYKCIYAFRITKKYKILRRYHDIGAHTYYFLYVEVSETARKMDRIKWP